MGGAFAGIFETHVTVDLPVDPDRFRADCARLGIKPILIALSSGRSPSQPMTSSIVQGDLNHALCECDRVSGKLRELGYVPTRLKIEAGNENAGIPLTDGEAALLPREYYFEHHVKFLVHRANDRERLSQIALAHDAHLSSNAMDVRADGSQEYFVTLRTYAAGRATADRRVDRLVTACGAAQLPLLKRICEYCVHDSNLDLDTGWA